jgi:hypothetical protein
MSVNSPSYFILSEPMSFWFYLSFRISDYCKDRPQLSPSTCQRDDRLTFFDWHLEYGNTDRRAVPWLKLLISGLSPCRPGFDPRPINAGFVLDKVSLGQAFLRVFRFPPVTIVSSMPVLINYFISSFIHSFIHSSIHPSATLNSRTNWQHP